MQTNEQNRSIVNTRIFNVPREVLFNAWSDPEQLAEWWGPKDFKNTFHEFDFKPDGTWKYTMHSPDGKDFLNTIIFEVIEKPNRIVLKHLLPVHVFWLTATFESVGSKTKLTFHQLFETVDECDRIRKFVEVANEQNLDRLEAVVYKSLIKK